MQWQQAVPKKKNWLERFNDQPHQPFFVAAVFWAIFTMMATFFSLIGKNIDFSLFHGFGLLYGVFTNAFFGFLLTVIPKYTNALPIGSKKYLSVFYIYQLGVILAFFIDPLLGKTVTAIAMVLTALIFFQTIKSGKFTQKYISKWLATLVLIGSGAIFIDDIAAFWIYIVPLVFVIGQRMIPAFYDSWFNRPSVEKPKLFVVPFIASFWLVGVGILLHLNILSAIGALIGAFLVGKFFFSLKPFVKTPAIVWILAVGVFWLEVGLIAQTVESFLDIYTGKMAFHIVAVGMLLTLLVGFGTRVILGHSNQKIHADRYAVNIFYFVQFVIVVRIVASVLQTLNLNAFIGILHLAAWSWILLFILWGARHAKTLLRTKD